MQVERLMARRVACCSVDDSLLDAVRIMEQCDCGFVPVVLGAGDLRVAGIITDRDACMAAYWADAPLSHIAVTDVMSTYVRGCRPEQDVSEAEQIMQEARVHRLPVMDRSGRLVGVISLTDIAREAAQDLGARHPVVTASEVAETLAAIRQRSASATTARRQG